MRRYIRKVGILGSGVMGSQIACLLANSGIPSLLLDLPNDTIANGSQSEKILKGKDLRNKISKDNLDKVLKFSPSPLADRTLLSLITIGNFEDDLKKLKECDWVIEAVIEDIQIKKDLLKKVSQVLKNTDNILSSNTSSISLTLLSSALEEDVKERFLGTHFFNPPRFLPLLEIIPTPHTNSKIVQEIMDFSIKYLGRKPVISKDSPGFIANRIGVYSILKVLNSVEGYNLSPSEVDFLFGEISGRPKSGIFRTADMVGLDTLLKVIDVIKQQLPLDKELSKEPSPVILHKMIEKKYLGEKTKIGFYKKQLVNGKSTILEINTQSMEYVPQSKITDIQFEPIKKEKDPIKRINMLWNVQGKYGDFFRSITTSTLIYAWNVLDEMAHDIYSVDLAMRYGFGWQIPPFTLWDILTPERIIDAAKKYNIPLPQKIDKLPKDGFYKKDDNYRTFYFDHSENTYKIIPGEDSPFNISVKRNTSALSKTNKSTFFHINNEVGVFLIHSRGNSLDMEVGQELLKALDYSVKNFAGLVIMGDGDNFSMGANLAFIYSLVMEQDYDEIANVVRSFQSLNQSIKYAPIPVVCALTGFVLGGGCELAMHASARVAFIDTFIGLVETGMGLIPAGGGIKEYLVKFTANSQSEGVIPEVYLTQFIKNIVTASVSDSAYKAKKLMYLQNGDLIVFSKDFLLPTAVKLIHTLSEKGYTPPVKSNIILYGKEALGLAYAGIETFYASGELSEFEKKVAKKVADVMCGGELSEPTQVSEEFILEREREAFLSLLTEPKTLERISTFLQTGKVVRN